MNRIEWTGTAIADLYDIDDYWSAYSNDAAERVADRIQAAAAFLGTMPRAGPVLRREDARKWRIPASPYILIYRVLDDRIQILRIRHGRENWTFE